jgi:hypothetical protein
MIECKKRTQLGPEGEVEGREGEVVVTWRDEGTEAPLTIGG